MGAQEAEISGIDEPQEVQVSTSELVFMIGEAAVRDRQNLKRLQFLDKQIEIVRNEALKYKSLALGAEEKNVAFEKIKTSLNARISDLERQLHEVATERDKYRNQSDFFPDRLTETESKKPKRKKRVKQAANTSRD